MNTVRSKKVEFRIIPNGGENVENGIHMTFGEKWRLGQIPSEIRQALCPGRIRSSALYENMTALNSQRYEDMTALNSKYSIFIKLILPGGAQTPPSNAFDFVSMRTQLRADLVFSCCCCWVSRCSLFCFCRRHCYRLLDSLKSQNCCV